MSSRHAALPGGDGWTVWRWVNVRSAGFPARAVLRLASPELASAADRYLDACDLERRLRQSAITACLEVRRRLDPAGRAEVGRLLNRLRGRGAPPETDMHGLAGVVRPVREAHAAVQSSWPEVERATHDAAARSREVLLETARDPRFAEAVIWQNRSAYHNGVESLLGQHPGLQASRSRERERLVASYLQRYAVKNDTIGFFGPEGIGRVVDEGPAISADPGPGLLATRRVYFEYWTIEALAETLASDPETKRWIAPRRMPTVRLEGEVLHTGTAAPVTLDAREAALLRACDGVLSAAALANELVSSDGGEWDDDAEVLAALEALVRRNWIVWTLEVPTGLSNPESGLREALGRLPRDVGERGLAALADLEQARDRVAAAAGDVRALDRAFDGLERTFTEWTHREATQNAGRTYAGRTLVYEDCLRDLDLRLGPSFLERMGPPVQLLLASARWYTHEIAARYRAVFDQILGAAGGDTLDAVPFLDLLAPHLAPARNGASAIVADVVEALQSRWADVLELAPGPGAIERSSRAIAARALGAFAAPHPGWPIARHGSPDLLVVARSLEAVQRGDYQLVLGELHAGVNTCMNAVFVEQHPHPEELLASYESDVAPTMDPVLPRSVAGHRTKVLARTSHDVSIEVDETRTWRARDRVLPIGELFVTRHDGRLVVRHRGSPVEFDLVELVQVDLMIASRHVFEPLPVTGHAARVSIDGLVLRRESWLFTPEQCAFAHAGEAVERFVGARRWARAHRLPRFLFAKIPEEKKPWYVDLASEVYVDLLAKMVRGASRLVVTEMLPSIEDTWLPDRDGRIYVAELRLAAVDPEPWRPS